MTLNRIKTTAAGIWVFGMGVAGVLIDVTSSSSWLALAGCAIVPPLVMLRYWNHPEQTMSQSIQRALR